MHLCVHHYCFPSYKGATKLGKGSQSTHGVKGYCSETKFYLSRSLSQEKKPLTQTEGAGRRDNGTSCCSFAVVQQEAKLPAFGRVRKQTGTNLYHFVLLLLAYFCSWI